MDKIRVILVEDDIKVCKKFEEYSLKYDDIDIIKITNNATEAIGFIKKLTPDAIILDLELSDGEGSGLDVLKAIYDNLIPSKPYILVTTNNPSDVTQRLTQELGVDFTLKKYQRGYSEEQALVYISMFKTHLLAKRNNSTDYFLDFENSLDSETPNNYKQKIFEELINYGFSPSNKGYKYFLEAIDFVIADKDSDFIKMLSLKYKVSRDSVTKAMQRAFNSAYDKHTTYKINSNNNVSTELFNGVVIPTISEVVHYYAQKIQIKK